MVVNLFERNLPSIVIDLKCINCGTVNLLYRERREWNKDSQYLGVRNNEILHDRQAKSSSPPPTSHSSSEQGKKSSQKTYLLKNIYFPTK